MSSLKMYTETMTIENCSPMSHKFFLTLALGLWCIEISRSQVHPPSLPSCQPFSHTRFRNTSIRKNKSLLVDVVYL
jgi:hypothetical protein